MVIHPYVNAAIAADLASERHRFPRHPERRIRSDSRLATRQEVRAALGVEERDFLVLNLATFAQRKAQELLIDTTSQLAAEKELPVKLLLVGFHDLQQRDKLLRKLGEREKAVLTPERAYVWQTQIAAFYRAADAFVMNTQGIDSLRGECFGRATAEAMAAGAVVLGTAAGGTAEIIVDGESGFLFPPGPDGQAVLADRIERLIREPALAARLSHAGRKRAASAFSEARFFTDFEACFRDRSQATLRT
jgi:glycosyltransferase involved in cell wall biosynthesis